MKTTRLVEARWIRHDEPIPEGWSLAHNEGRINDRHNYYARMIVREVKENDEHRD